ncbi:hypothetical protein D9615_009571 [Tricholomella constricta]|uniref:Uncharacterized protein n=1 Tax=Tricholomella constricta TaxID=117010 RepID=A0A8H5LW72_9AGAR|nr:hypothetical protein D9615_009571 [Tricholomella constricta]
MPQLDIGRTFGAMFIGALLTMSVYGITTLQTYFYYTYYPKDAYGTKALVAIIWMLDTLHVILMCHSMYYYLISGFGNALMLVEGNWSLFTSIAINVIIAFVVQCFFTKRIYTLSPDRIKWWLSGIIGLTVFAHFFFGMETVVYFFKKREFSRLKELNFISVLPFAITAILSDILIATALVLLLASNLSDFEDTNTIINRLIVYAINRCILTSAVAVIEVVVFVAVPNSFYSFAFDFIIGKLYANSLLATLNSRKALRGKGQDDNSRATSTSFRLASVATHDDPTSMIRAPSRESATEGRRRVPSGDLESKIETMAGSINKSRRSYPSVNLADFPKRTSQTAMHRPATPPPTYPCACPSHSLLHVVCPGQSRYAIQDASLLHGESSLVKRISYELLHPDASTASSGSGKQCRPLAYSLEDQCTHVQKDCRAPETFLSINYLRHYYCTSIPLRPVAFGSLLIWLIFLFSTLGISASDFFTPNLATIAQLLGLDENVAGVTFLAFGNGSPDVFSTFSAMRANSGSLAIGELLGAASFIVSCVVGSMCIIKPFRVQRGPFLRDVGFFAVAVSLLLVILWDGQIHPWEAGLLIALYIFYVALVVVGTWWERRQELKRHTEAMIRAEYDDGDATFIEPYRDNNSASGSTIAISISPPSPSRSRAISAPDRPRIHTNLPPRPRSRNPSPTPSTSSHPQLPSFSLVGALEFRNVVNSLQHQAAGTSLNMFESPVTPYAGGHYHAHPASRQRTPKSSLSSRDYDPWDSALNAVALDDRGRSSLQPSPAMSPTITEEPGHMLDSQSSDYFRHSLSPGTAVPSIIRTSAPSSEGDAESQVYIPPTRRQRVWYVVGEVCHTLFPSLHHFKNQSILGQIASIFAAPAVMFLTLTLPVVVTPYQCSNTAREKTYHHHRDGRLVDFEEEGEARVLIAEEEVLEDMHEMTFNKWLMAVQCALAPVFCVAVLFNGTRHVIGLLIAAALGGFVFAVLVAVFSDKGDHPTARMARCSMGFFVAIVWIMAIADEVVNVLQTFGFMFGLSDAIIGLTIFAVGNSLADLVANMSVAVFAPIMGFSACFGGPMLNILLGVGVSGTYIIQQTSTPYDLHFSNTLLVSTIGLLILLASTLVFVPLNDYFLTRRWGILLIASYTILMSINVIVELKSESRHR